LRFVRILLLILVVLLLLPYLVTPFYRTGHPVSTLMAWRWLKGAPVSRQWIDFKSISPSLPRSVVGSEDAKFCSHRGVDWSALKDAIEDHEEGEVAGGGSTINDIERLMKENPEEYRERAMRGDFAGVDLTRR